MFKHQAISFVSGVALGAAAVLLFWERRPAEVQLTPSNEDTSNSTTVPIITRTESDVRELARLRGEATRLRRENAELHRASPSDRRMDDSHRNERQPAFNYSFLTRDVWTNAGVATPEATI